MSTDRLRARHLGWIAAALVAASLTAACSDDGGDAVSHTPLATTAPGGSDLLCDIVPRQSVATALGYEPGAVETNHGDTTTITTDPNTGHVNGRCLIRSATRSEMALTVTVLWPSHVMRRPVSTFRVHSSCGRTSGNGRGGVRWWPPKKYSPSNGSGFPCSPGPRPDGLRNT